MLQFGDNGLLKKSKEAVDKSKLAQTEELIKMDLLSAYIDAELAGQDKPSNDIIKEIVEKHGGTIDESNPNVIQTPNGEIRLDDVLEDTSSDTQDVDKLNETIKNLNNKIAELNSQLRTEQSEKAELQTQVSNLNGQVTELNTQVADWKKKAEDGEVTIAEKDTQISNLNSQITEKNEEIENKTNRITELEGNVETLTNEKTSLENQVSNLNTRIAELEGKQATGDATASDVLEGKTFSNGSGVNLTGTMANRGTLNFNPSTSTTQAVEPGYYTGGSLSSKEAYENGYNRGLAKGYRLTSFTKEDAKITICGMEFFVYDLVLPDGMIDVIFAMIEQNDKFEFNDWDQIISGASGIDNHWDMRSLGIFTIADGKIRVVSTFENPGAVWVTRNSCSISRHKINLINI